MLKLAWIAVAGAGALASARAPHLSPQLDGLSFLVGNWASGRGHVADTGGTSTGRSMITEEVGGNVLLRRDHTDLFDAAGKPSGSLEQVMMIYPEDGSVHADYSDGTHIIHYVTTEIVAGHSVIFTSEHKANSPTFRLRYELTRPTTLSVTFQMAAPGSADFHLVAAGSLTKAS